MSMLARMLLMFGTALLPIYLTVSGEMQPSHVVLGMYCAGYLVVRGGRFIVSELILFGLLLIVAVRELVSAITTGSFDALLPAAHLLFSILIFNVVRRIATGSSLSAIHFGLRVALSAAVIGVLVLGFSLRVGDDMSRAIGTFNNPNQLGYFSVLMLSIFALLRYQRMVSVYEFIAVALACTFLAAVSLSKAALISVAFGISLTGFTLTRGRFSLISGFMLLTIAVTVGYATYFGKIYQEYVFVQRVQGIGDQEDDSMKGRGYQALSDATGEEIIFGLGVSKAQQILGHEIHSTIFSYVGGYGLFGGALFIAFIVLWTYRVYQCYGMEGVLVICVPVMAYGLTHNGSRFTLFWILLALTFGISGQKTSIMHNTQTRLPAIR